MAWHKYGESKTGFPSYTLATLPAASTFPDNSVVHISDVGVNGGSHWYAKSGVWYPVNGSCMLAASAVAVSVTGTVAKTTTATVVIPALLGLNGRVRVSAAMSVTNNANSKGALIEFGGQAVMSSTLASIASTCGTFDVANRNNASAQLSTSRGGTFGNNGTSSQPVATTTVNTAVAQNLVFSFTLANSADTATLESYTVELRK